MTLYIDKRADISPTRVYRYSLYRKWANDMPTALFIMLNPSTADGIQDDPTIRRCVSFAKREKCGGMIIENLYGFRATNPDDMFNSPYPIGDTDSKILTSALIVNGPIIAAWGADKRASKRAKEIMNLLNGIGFSVKCLGLSKSGAPRHPLYLKAEAPLMDFNNV